MRFLNRLSDRLKEPSIPQVRTRQCWQPWESLNIAADGNVYPCCVVNEQLLVGSLRTQSLEEIVAAAAMVGLKRRLLTGDIADLPCAECTNAPMGPAGEYIDQLNRLLSK